MLPDVANTGGGKSQGGSVSRTRGIIGGSAGTRVVLGALAAW